MKKSSSPLTDEITALPRSVTNCNRTHKSFGFLRLRYSMMRGVGVRHNHNAQKAESSLRAKNQSNPHLLASLGDAQLIQNESKRTTLSPAYACAFRLIRGRGVSLVATPLPAAPTPNDDWTDNDENHERFQGKDPERLVGPLRKEFVV